MAHQWHSCQRFPGRRSCWWTVGGSLHGSWCTDSCTYFSLGFATSLHPVSQLQEGSCLGSQGRIVAVYPGLVAWAAVLAAEGWRCVLGTGGFWLRAAQPERAWLGTFLGEAKLKIQNSLLGKGAQAHLCGRLLRQGHGIMVNVAGASMHAHLGLLACGTARRGSARTWVQRMDEGNVPSAGLDGFGDQGSVHPAGLQGKRRATESGGWLQGGAMSQCDELYALEEISFWKRRRCLGDRRSRGFAVPAGAEEGRPPIVHWETCAREQLCFGGILLLPEFPLAAISPRSVLPHTWLEIVSLCMIVASLGTFPCLVAWERFPDPHGRLEIVSQ
jgi:hypothetical protein